MNLKRDLILVLCACILGGCQKPPAISTPISKTEPTVVGSLQSATMSNSIQTREEAENGESYAIYLVADPQIAGPDLKDSLLEALPLAEEPLISIEDILSYDWENHVFKVTEESYQRLIDDIGGSVPVNGRSFVVVAKGERIYAGAFWTLASSLSFDGVTIMDPLVSESTSLTFALGYPTEEYFTGEDPRGDLRIREVLEDLDLIQ